MDMDKFFRGLSDIFASGHSGQVSAYLRLNLENAGQEDDKGASVAILNEMIGYFRSVSAFVEAFAAGERALALLREMGLEDSEHYGTTLLNFATARRAAGDSAAALHMFESALAIFKIRLPGNDPRLAGLYNNLSAIHQDAGEFEKAREALERAAAIMEPLPALAVDLATVYSNLSLALFALRRDAEATWRLADAMRIFEREGATARSDARKAPHYAAALAGFAAICRKAGQTAKAAAIYEDALERIKDCFGENRDYAVTCRNCAEAHAALGDLERAAALREKASEIMNRLGVAHTFQS